MDPDFRQRLLKESRNPFRGLRRIIWLTLFGSAFIGLSIMSLKVFAGNGIQLTDAGVQVSALLIFGGLLWLDKDQ